jgi:hypothetical protein
MMFVIPLELFMTWCIFPLFFIFRVCAGMPTHFRSHFGGRADEISPEELFNMFFGQMGGQMGGI